jgi:hypothetical protein
LKEWLIFLFFFVSQMHQGMELGVSYVRIVINSSKAQMTIELKKCLTPLPQAKI